MGGLALSVLTGSADDAAIGALIGNLIGGVGVTPGIILTSAVGATIAYLVANANDDQDDIGNNNEDAKRNTKDRGKAEDNIVDSVESQTYSDIKGMSRNTAELLQGDKILETDSSSQTWQGIVEEKLAEVDTMESDTKGRNLGGSTLKSMQF